MEYIGNTLRREMAIEEDMWKYKRFLQLRYERELINGLLMRLTWVQILIADQLKKRYFYEN